MNNEAFEQGELLIKVINLNYTSNLFFNRFWIPSMILKNQYFITKSLHQNELLCVSLIRLNACFDAFGEFLAKHIILIL